MLSLYSFCLRAGSESTEKQGIFSRLFRLFVEPNPLFEKTGGRFNSSGFFSAVSVSFVHSGTGQDVKALSARKMKKAI